MILIAGLFYKIHTNTYAEQSGSSPESGADSRIKDGYDFLVGKGSNYGSTDAADWDSSTNNWGTYLNRIMEAAAWEPDGTLAAADVSPGKTFYAGNGDRTQKTGLGTYYANQQLSDFDDFSGSDNTSEEATWTQTNTTPEIWYDTRTGLYWSSSPTGQTNIFPDTTHSTCDFFGETDRGNYAGGDADCGNAINTCATLTDDADNDSVADTDWYLPSQKEMHQAYIDGIYNQTSTSWVGTSLHWTATEVSNNATNAFRVALNTGFTTNSAKINTNSVKCVRRD